MKITKQALIIIATLIVLYEIVLLTRSWILSPASSQNNFGELASAVVKKCENSSYKASCYEKEIPKLMDRPYNLSMENVFKVIPFVQREDSSYVYCHVLGHEISAKETKRDPSKWTGVIARCPSGVCSNGCIHGAFQEKFRKEFLNDAQIEHLLPVLKTVCEKRGSWSPTGMERASCYHALGHLLMYITNGSTTKASDLCDRILNTEDTSNLSRVCYDGVFMQIYQPLEPEDFALIKGKQPKKDGVESYCSQFSEDKRASCLNESWPIVMPNFTAENVTAFCSQIGDSGDLVDRCYNAMFYVATVQLGFDEKRLTPLCENMPVDRRGQCFANVASRMIETDWNNVDRSLRFCTKADSLGVGDKCYSEMIQYAYFNFHEGSTEQKNLCNSLPGHWKTDCVQKNIPQK